MKRSLAHLSIVVALVLPAFAHAHEADAQGGVLGTVSFSTSCDPKLQKDFDRATAMLHSFWYKAAEDAFRDILKKDPQCAVATWGIASTFMSNPLAGQGATPKGAEAAQAAIDEGRRIGAKTQRERDYIEAVAAYYQDFSSRPEKDRQATRAKAYEALAQRYPDDDEAQIFAALYLAATQQQSDQTYSAYLKAAAVLEDQFRRHPDHPGVAHYLIHCYDAPPIADKGVKAARLYAGIAPAAPHALHMPSHIFTRVGYWQESASTNARSMEVAKAAGDIDEAYHAADYMVYANLQLARDAEVQRSMDAALKVPGASSRFVAPYAIAAMPARYVFERGAWAEASKLQPPGSNYPFVESITYFARSVGEARSGDLVAARKDADQLEVQHKALLAAKNTYWATEVEVQRLARMDRVRRRQDRRGTQADACRGGSRGQEREAHRHPRARRPGPRALGRDAARGETTGSGARGIRSVAATRAQSLSQLRGFCARRGDDRRSGEGRELLREASGARQGR